jgi:AcrR family transcriptional regulator
MNSGREDVMEATYLALCDHSYADLTIERIAGKSDMGKSAIYYHFDDKHDLMLTFLDFLEQKMQEESSKLSELEPEERLDKMLEMALAVDDQEMLEFRKALLEMKAQTPYDRKFSEKFHEIDRFLREDFEEVLEEKGLSNPAEKSRILVSAIDGLMDRKIGYRDEQEMHEVKNQLKNLISGEKT